MSTQMNSTGVTFPHGGTQSLAADNSQYSVGQYGFSNYNSATVGSTYSGSTLGLSTGTWKCLSFHSDNLSYSNEFGTSFSFTIYYGLYKRTV